MFNVHIAHKYLAAYSNLLNVVSVFAARSRSVLKEESKHLHGIAPSKTYYFPGLSCFFIIFNMAVKIFRISLCI